FAELWEFLKSRGWQYRSGTGLVDWVYIRPVEGLGKGGKEGQDYFTSISAVESYAMRQGL
ncbi:unnamed protein product, partial [Discosporangium mesarthrocarpum]